MHKRNELTKFKEHADYSLQSGDVWREHSDHQMSWLRREKRYQIRVWMAKGFKAEK